MNAPRYFCEYCGAEVRRNARVCPRCGRFFSSVKCPKCGHVGRAADFDTGCPVCGYRVVANLPPEELRPSQVRSPAPPLPWWAFAVVALIIAALLALLFGIQR